MIIIRNLVFIGVSFGLAYYGAAYWFHISGRLDYGLVAWIVAIYTLVATFLLTVFGGRHRYWWIAFAVAPFLFLFFFLVLPPIGLISSFELRENLYWLCVWGLFLGVGIGVGLPVRRVLIKLVPSFMSRIS